MATVAALILAAIICADCLTGDHLGLKKPFFCLFRSRHSRWFMIAGVVCAGLLALMLATGPLSVDELIEQERLCVELCPWCM